MKPLHKHDYLYVVAFDISCDRTRRKISSFLEDQGMRVQESVFEIVTSAYRMKELSQTLEEMICMNGTIRIYPLTQNSVNKTITINAQRPLTCGEPWIF